MTYTPKMRRRRMRRRSGQERKRAPGRSRARRAGTGRPLIDENGSYTTKEDVALYIHTYGKLPGNFITKKEAQKLGWSGGSLEPYATEITGNAISIHSGRRREEQSGSYIPMMGEFTIHRTITKHLSSFTDVKERRS